MSNETWPLGVFASIDAGLGVKLEVAHALGVPTIQLHAPAASTRTPENAKAFLAKLSDLNIRLTCVFCGFEGESYADIPTVKETVGLVPKGPPPCPNSGNKGDLRFCQAAFGRLHRPPHWIRTPRCQ